MGSMTSTRSATFMTNIDIVLDNYNGHSAGAQLSDPVEKFLDFGCIQAGGGLIHHEQTRRGRKRAERLCGLEVDHKLELVGLLHRKIGRLSASKDAIDVLSSLSELVNGVILYDSKPPLVAKWRYG